MSSPKVPTFEEILALVQARYGHLSLDEMRAAVERDGFGELFEEVEAIIGEHPELLAAATELGLPEEGMDVMPVSPHSETLKLGLEDRIFFEHKECLRSCAGNCCKRRAYLMISIADIYRIVSSPAAPRYGVESTSDLFRHAPPLVQVFFNAEYGLYLPYIRFLPLDASPDTLPEDAPSNICPFLVPIEEVCAALGKKLPDWAGKQAMGCILMRHKPKVCRLSPVVKAAGLVTGKVHYEYVRPAVECPACDSGVSVPLTEYLAGAVLPGEDTLDAQFHQAVMAAAQPHDRSHRHRFNEILKELYDIDGLVARHGAPRWRRPDLTKVIEIAVRASRADFEPYENLLKELKRAAGKG